MTSLSNASSTATQSKGLFVFGNDLRVRDNRALSALSAQVDGLDCVYVIQPSYVNYGSASRGAVPTMYLKQSLTQLNYALREFGQCLTVLEGDWVSHIVAYCVDHHITHVGLSDVCGDYELHALMTLRQHLKALNINVTVVAQTTLFELPQWPQEPQPHTVSFSRFRHTIERAELSVRAVFEVTQIAPPIHSLLVSDSKPHDLKLNRTRASRIELETLQYKSKTSHIQHWTALAGCLQGKIHLNHYFGSTLPQRYKQTRNAIDDWDSSTKLSPWLAFGSLSVREVFQALKQHEAQFGANDSTQWIKFELLWREYFYWQTHFAGQSMFALSGVNDKDSKPRQCGGSNQRENFKRWSHGQTPYPIVNAIIKQLNKTGYISNRARQIAASCWINEYQGDWRWGAAHFQQQLIDFDVAVNWGNWQYIAGVGFDAKKGRHFDLGKQTQLFDPLGHYIQRWDPAFQSSGEGSLANPRGRATHPTTNHNPQMGLPMHFS